MRVGVRALLTVDFFQGELLGLSHEAEYHKPRHEVQSSIETD